MQLSRSRAPETTSWYVSSSTWANFNTRHGREQLTQSKRFKAVWSHVVERNSPMHLRQEKQETYHTQTRGHSPAQLVHPARSNATLSTWGAGCDTHARERPHSRMSGGQRGHMSVRNSEGNTLWGQANFTVRAFDRPPPRSEAKDDEAWRLMARHNLAVRERGTVPGARGSWGETRLQGVRRQPWD